MTAFVIIRHGESEANLYRRHAGQQDVPLSPLGHAQAACMAEYVAKHFRIDAIYSSDLSRARDTARPLAERLGLPIRERSDLREISVGNWQGRPFDEVAAKEPALYASYHAAPGLFTFPGGESFAALAARGARAFAAMAAENEGKTVAVATHGGLIRTLCCTWQGWPLSRYGELAPFSNTSLTVIRYDGGQVELLRVNDTAHLQTL
ncbi:MAG: histidine phosphatase family protein [Clostridia bacterium]|nr:histidine phosphatase family protein [Clostridia bacterium]